jgi:hypothetical protein
MTYLQPGFKELGERDFVSEGLCGYYFFSPSPLSSPARGEDIFFVQTSKSLFSSASLSVLWCELK